jgi:uncharacterized membrane protein YeiH
MDFDQLIFILEMIGTAAFAVSGVMVAKQRKMDIFGAIVLGDVTAVGGGVIRDLILGTTPPVMFERPVYILFATVVCILDFLYERSRADGRLPGKMEQAYARSGEVLNAADSIGLAAFVVVGCRTALNAGFQDNLFLVSFVGVVTGIGGGILRDMMAGQMPLIMRKRVYGIAAAAGAVLYSLLARSVSETSAAGVSMAVTVFVRFLAIHYRWNLPGFGGDEKGTGRNG